MPAKYFREGVGSPIFFPDPYPDELLYSIIARYHKRSGNILFSNTILELFGNLDVQIMFDVPNYINILAERLQMVIGLTAKELILNNTLFPYYTAFLPEYEVQTVYEAMKGNEKYDVGVLGEIRPKYYLIDSFKCLKYCTLCNNESLMKFGEYYWHRIHNVPCAFICPFHKTFLKCSTIELKKIDKFECISADMENCSGTPTGNLEIDDFDALLFHIEGVEWLFNNYKMIRSDNDVKFSFLNQFRPLNKLSYEYLPFGWDHEMMITHHIYFSNSHNCFEALLRHNCNDNKPNWLISFTHLPLNYYSCKSNYCKLIPCLSDIIKK